MMRASPGAAPRLSRAVASRYFARYDSSRSRCAFASRSSARSSTSCPLVEAACCLSWSRPLVSDSTRAPAMRASFSSERASRAGLVADLLVEIVDLRLQLLDARMVVEQRGGLLGKLRAQRHALLVEPADQFGIDHVGGFERAAALEQIADEARLRLKLGLLRARGREIAVGFAQRLVRQRGVVGADEQVGLGAEVLDLRLRFGDALAQHVDLAREPAARRAGLLLPRGLLQREVVVGDRVGDARRKLRIGRLEFDRDHARLVDRKRSQPLVIGFEHALFRRHAQRVLGKPEEAERIADQRHAAQRRIEFRQFAELELLDHLAGDIARQRKLHLAGHRFLDRPCGRARSRPSRPRAAGRRSRALRSGCALRTCISA